MPSQTLLKRDWQKDHVYLVQFPRAGCIPSPSPFALKLETWLRMVDIDYSNISNEFKKYSEKGQVPFVELNGRQIADSNIIIDNLTEHFQKDADSKLTPQERARMIAYKSLVENHLVWVLMFYRGRNNSWIKTDKGFIGHVSGLKKLLFKNVMCNQLRKKCQRAAFTQGMGRNSPSEVDEIAEKDLSALETFLGSKAYFFGPTPTTFDCVVFGVVAQLLYTPLQTDHLKKYIEGKCPSLFSLVTRMKQQYWPDWDEATAKLSLNTKWKPQ